MAIVPKVSVAAVINTVENTQLRIQQYFQWTHFTLAQIKSTPVLDSCTGPNQQSIYPSIHLSIHL